MSSRQSKYRVHLQQLRLLVLICCAAVSFASQGQPIAAGATACQPSIRFAHLSQSCLEKDNVLSPSVEVSCGALRSLQYIDRYYELASETGGKEAAYFAFSRWEKKSGDGGVDVTGAPGCILVEGANIAQFTVAPSRAAILRMVVPAMGYATFDWKNLGGSNLLFSVMVNDQMDRPKNQGFYRSPLLKAGDILALRVENVGAQEARLQVANFEFLTNAIGVIERQWTAADSGGNTAQAVQLIAIEPLPLANIIFPEDTDVSDPKNNLPKEPTFTGFPLFDADGNSLTTHDQRVLRASNCAFALSWQDELVAEQQSYIILRRWSVTDANANVRTHTQRIHLGHTPPSGLRHSDKSQTSLISNDSTYNGQLKGLTHPTIAAVTDINIANWQ